MEVKAKAEELLSDNKSYIAASRLSSSKLDVNEPEEAPANYHRTLYSILCQPSISRLSKILKGAGFNRFVIAFDECSNLNLATENRTADDVYNLRPKWDMSLIALQRIIKAGDGFTSGDVTFWYLLLDTNSSIFDLAPAGPESPSDRLTHNLIPLPVWPYLGFNQMVPTRYTESIKTAAQVLSVKHLKAYGRPVSSDIPFYPHTLPRILCFQYWFGIDTPDVLRAATEKLFHQPSHGVPFRAGPGHRRCEIFEPLL